MTNVIISFNVQQAGTQIPSLWAYHSNTLAEQNEVEGLPLSSLSISLKYPKTKGKKTRRRLSSERKRMAKMSGRTDIKKPTKSYNIWKDQVNNGLRRKFLNSCVHCENLVMLACLSHTGLLPEDGTVPEVRNELFPKSCKTISHQERYCQKCSCSRIHPVSTTILLTRSQDIVSSSTLVELLLLQYIATGANYMEKVPQWAQGHMFQPTLQKIIYNRMHMPSVQH